MLFDPVNTPAAAADDDDEEEDKRYTSKDVTAFVEFAGWTDTVNVERPRQAIIAIMEQTTINNDDEKALVKATRSFVADTVDLVRKNAFNEYDFSFFVLQNKIVSLLF